MRGAETGSRDQGSVPAGTSAMNASALDSAGAAGEDELPFSAAELLRLAAAGRHSVVIDVAVAGQHLGRVTVHHGELWSAEAGDLVGDDAARAVLFVPGSSTACRGTAGFPGKKTVTSDFELALPDVAVPTDELREGGAAASRLEASPAAVVSGPAEGDHDLASEWDAWLGGMVAQLGCDSASVHDRRGRMAARVGGTVDADVANAEMRVLAAVESLHHLADPGEGYEADVAVSQRGRWIAGLEAEGGGRCIVVIVSGKAPVAQPVLAGFRRELGARLAAMPGAGPGGVDGVFSRAHGEEAEAGAPQRP